MVAGSIVREVASNLSSILSNYSSQIQSLSSSWKGLSYDNISKQAEEFKSEYEGTIKSQVESFASACDEYQNYIEMKKALETAKNNYEKCKNANDKVNMQAWSNEITTITENIKTLKTNIETYLSNASSKTLSASSINPSISGTSTANANPTSTVDKSDSAVKAHSRISEAERQRRLEYLGGSGSKSEQDKKMTTIKVPYWDGKETKEMTLNVNKKLTSNYYNAFKELADMHYTILPKQTGAYNYRRTTSGKRLSDHCYGGAVDVNWEHNENEGDASKYAVRKNEAVINAFAKQGFYWGGDWNSWHDDMHFSYTGW